MFTQLVILYSIYTSYPECIFIMEHTLHLLHAHKYVNVNRSEQKKATSHSILITLTSCEVIATRYGDKFIKKKRKKKTDLNFMSIYNIYTILLESMYNMGKYFISKRYIFS